MFAFKVLLEVAEDSAVEAQAGVVDEVVDAVGLQAEEGEVEEEWERRDDEWHLPSLEPIEAKLAPQGPLAGRLRRARERIRCKPLFGQNGEQSGDESEQETARQKSVCELEAGGGSAIDWRHSGETIECLLVSDVKPNERADIDSRDLAKVLLDLLIYGDDECGCHGGEQTRLIVRVHNARVNCRIIFM